MWKNSSVPLIVLITTALSSYLVISVNSEETVRKSYRNSQRIVFPDEQEVKNQVKERYKKDTREVTEESCCEFNDIPLDLAKELSMMSDEDKFVSLLDESSLDERIFSNNSFEFRSRFGDAERSPGVRPKPAGCNTEPTIVSLRPEHDTDPTIVYVPACTRVNRCSGCCYSKLLSCQPSQTRDIPFEVLKSQYTSGRKLKFLGKEIQLVEEHIACECGCRIKETDCDASVQKYNRNNCRCDCTNIDDRNKCLTESDYKIWNPNTCRCECRDDKECTTGSHFDPNTCKCVQIQTQRRYTAEERRRLILRPVQANHNYKPNS